MKPYILWDFDGTLYRGIRPFIIYTSSILNLLGEEDTGEIKEIERRLKDYDHFYGNDGYEIVARYFSSVPSRILQAAYEEMRETLLDHPEYVEVPQKLQEFLKRSKEKSIMIVASNSPEPYVTPFMEKLGLVDYFSRIISWAAKPEGIIRIIKELPEDANLLSVGDHYPNDIAPAIELGKDAAYISPYSTGNMKATFKGKKIEDVLPKMSKWIDSHIN
ncbi:HAD family hydrolase [Cuniculiplasma sp. SKW3]|uniref:HAD family hydrolase n=1 Tax=Cuniculiplasma sp. SKW3 TaxID=3400170 RepID=UPI003FD55532